jgi:dihydrofolate reductase
MKGGKKVVLVAAVGENGVIGNQGVLPWRLKSDLQHFKKLTLNKPVIMGRRTFESIGKALKGRTNIVLTGDLSLRAPGAVLATSLDAAFAFARQDAERRGVDEIMVAAADRLEITRVHARPEGDTLFPPIDPEQWREVRREPHMRGLDDEADFTILTYERIG